MDKASVILAAAVLISGCNRQPTAWQYPSPSSATRPANVPVENVITLPKHADLSAATKASSDEGITKAIQQYLGPSAPKWKISAARDLGDYVLLWIWFPDVADGGIDLVFSKPGKRIKWQFLGGIRG